MKRVKIVTHSGRCHRDEFLSCCVIMFHAYRNGILAFVERRLVGESDLQDSNTWVVDTGGRYEPDFLNFDHHQDDPALEAFCAFDLVLAQILGKRGCDAYRACSPWMRMTALHDTMGGPAAAQSVGIDMKAYASTRSPVEKCMLNAFSEVVTVSPDGPLAIFMREIGRHIIMEAEEFTSGMQDRLIACPAPFVLAGLRVWDTRSAWGTDENLSMALVNQAASAKSVDLVIGRNHRTGGIGLYRSSWATSKLDLSRLRDRSETKFVHKNGFYAVITNEVSDNDLAALVRMSSLMPAGDVSD